MNWSEMVPVLATYSVVLCVVFTVMLVAIGYAAPDAMSHDYPQAIQERYGPKSARGRRVGAVAGVLMAAGFVALPVAGMTDLAVRIGAAPGFWDGFVFGVVMFVVLNVYDLLVVDWWLFCTVQPRFLVLPGTEGMAEYRDRSFHWKVLVPRPVPWPLLMIPAYGVLVGAGTALVGAIA